MIILTEISALCRVGVLGDNDHSLSHRQVHNQLTELYKNQIEKDQMLRLIADAARLEKMPAYDQNQASYDFLFP